MSRLCLFSVLFHIRLSFKSMKRSDVSWCNVLFALPIFRAEIIFQSSTVIEFPLRPIQIAYEVIFALMAAMHKTCLQQPEQRGSPCIICGVHFHNLIP